MLKYNRIDISEGTDADKINESRECKFCNYCHFVITCDGCYDMVQRSTDFRNIAIPHIKKTAYKIYFCHMSKHKAKKTMNRFDLIGKTRNIYYND